jgi:hypothetical protein
MFTRPGRLSDKLPIPYANEQVKWLVCHSLSDLIDTGRWQSGTVVPTGSVRDGSQVLAGGCGRHSLAGVATGCPVQNQQPGGRSIHSQDPLIHPGRDAGPGVLRITLDLLSAPLYCRLPAMLTEVPTPLICP